MKTNTRRFAYFIGAMTLAVTLGCASTAKQEGTGEYVDDTVITTKVKAAILERADAEVGRSQRRDLQGRRAAERLREFEGRGKQGRRGCAHRRGRQVRQGRHAGQVVLSVAAMSTGNPPACTNAGVQAGSSVAPDPAVDSSLITLPATGIQVDARGIALAILAVLASLYALSWAQAFVVPLLLGIIFSYTLNPLVAWLEAIRLPRSVATIIVMAGVTAALGFGSYSLRGQVQTIIEQLPEAAAKFTSGLSRLQSSKGGNMQKVQSAATEMEKAANQAAAAPGAPRSRPPTSLWISRHSNLAAFCGRARWERSAPLARR